MFFLDHHHDIFECNPFEDRRTSDALLAASEEKLRACEKKLKEHEAQMEAFQLRAGRKIINKTTASRNSKNIKS